MNDQQDLLIKMFRERLSNYEQRPEAELWSKIEQQLSYRKPRAILPVWRWVGVAASILLVLAVSLVYFSGDRAIENNKIAIHANSEMQPSVNEDKPIVYQPETNNSLAVNQSPLIHGLAKSTVKTDNANIHLLASEETGVPAPISQQPDSQLEEQISLDEEKTNDTPLKKIHLDEPDVPDNLWDHNRSSKPKSRTMLALSVGNSGTNPSGLFNRNASDKPIYNYNAIQYYSNMSADDFDQPEPQLRSAGSNNNSNYVLTNVDYNKIPLTYSLYFRIHLSSSFALESGLSYTYLSSREYYLLGNEPSLIKDVKLHYLGIPVKGIWSVYNNNRFSCYLAGGGSIEKCINGKETVLVEGTSTSSSFSVPELQYSVAGGIGANYLLFDRLGIFVEPGVSYFFDDGNEVRTIRKKTPFNFQVQAGIRMVW